MLINDPITTIPFIGIKQQNILNKLEIYTIFDLLSHFPAYYKDSSQINELNQFDSITKRTAVATIKEIKNVRLRNGKFIQKGIVYDESGEYKVMWFNQVFLTKTLKPGSIALISGKLNPKAKIPEIISPEYELLKTKNLHLGRIVPVYPLTKGLSVKWLRARLNYLIEHIKNISDFNSDLPHELELKYSLINAIEAHIYIHQPQNRDEIIKARKRLAFSELLHIYLKLIIEKQSRKEGRAVKINFDFNSLRPFIDNLPFTLTSSQIKTINEIIRDFNKNIPMYRLLQGDVGSGKTIVAILISIAIIQHGFKVVLLAPTSVLAQQHYNNIKKLIGHKIKIQLVTAKSKGEKYIGPELIIATHALLYHKDELLENLGLVIIDEQHRFGVKQRQELMDLKDRQYMPHLLHMTATPIPRSIALTLFGEIDVSTIIKPEKRMPIQTKIVPNSKREDAYKWIINKINEGGQVFWICPLIDETLELDINLKRVNELYQELTTKYPKLKIGLLHGKLNEKTKTSILSNFQEHKIDILVSTTVVEVGVDIPGANIMIIENADRYGLAQLHQLRGRVGRNNQESWCLLFTELNSNIRVTNRLRFFASEIDGLRIAEFDLKQRGPGEVYGTIQAGIPKLKIANFGNIEFLKTVRQAAQDYMLLKK